MNELVTKYRPIWVIEIELKLGDKNSWGCGCQTYKKLCKSIVFLRYNTNKSEIKTVFIRYLVILFDNIILIFV